MRAGTTTTPVWILMAEKMTHARRSADLTATRELTTPTTTAMNLKNLSDDVALVTCARCGAQIAVSLGELDPSLRDCAARLASRLLCSGCQSSKPRLPVSKPIAQRE